MSDVEKTLTKVRQLIALAVSSHSVNEGRTAAFEACKLIQVHKLTVGRPEGAELPPAPKGTTGFGGWGDEIFSDFFDRSKATRVDMQVQNATRGGTCYGCQKGYQSGERIAFFRDITVTPARMRAFHIACSSQRNRTR